MTLRFLGQNTTHSTKWAGKGAGRILTVGGTDTGLSCGTNCDKYIQQSRYCTSLSFG